jgi:hypothetical protein
MSMKPWTQTSPTKKRIRNQKTKRIYHQQNYSKKKEIVKGSILYRKEKVKEKGREAVKEGRISKTFNKYNRLYFSAW